MATLSLYSDYAAKTLVTSLTNSSQLNLPSLYNTNLTVLGITLLSQSGNPIAPYSVFTATGYTLDVVVGPTPSGTSPPALLASALAIVPSGNVFTANLNINTTGVAAYIGTLPSKSAFFELTLIDSSANRFTIYQGTVNLCAALDATGAMVPSPSTSYLTAAQSQSMFARLYGQPGQTVTVVSPGNLYQRTFGVDDSGNRIDDVTTVP